MAPSYRQAKQIAWERLKTITRPWLADQPDSLRRAGLDFVVLDEYASMRRECWTEVLRPALSGRRGRALFIGKPQGCDHLYEQFEYAKTDEEWAAFRFTTREGRNVSEEELASAAREMDARLWRQEFEASFDAAGPGRAYEAFTREGNVGRARTGRRFRWRGRLISM